MTIHNQWGTKSDPVTGPSPYPVRTAGLASPQAGPRWASSGVGRSAVDSRAGRFLPTPALLKGPSPDPGSCQGRRWS
jgi:hypothetical protein